MSSAWCLTPNTLKMSLTSARLTTCGGICVRDGGGGDDDDVAKEAAAAWKSVALA